MPGLDNHRTNTVEYQQPTYWINRSIYDNFVSGALHLSDALQNSTGGVYYKKEENRSRRLAINNFLKIITLSADIPSVKQEIENPANKRSFKTAQELTDKVRNAVVQKTPTMILNTYWHEYVDILMKTKVLTQFEALGNEFDGFRK